MDQNEIEELDADMANAFEDAVNDRPFDVAQPDSPTKEEMEAQRLADEEAAAAEQTPEEIEAEEAAAAEAAAAAAAEEQTPEEIAAAEAAAAEPAPPAADDAAAAALKQVTEQNEKLLARLEALEKAPPAAPAAPAAEALPEAEPAPQVIDLSDDDKAFVEQVSEDWPDVMKAFDMRLDVLVQRVAGLMYNMQTNMNQQLTPLMEHSQQQVRDTTWTSAAGEDAVTLKKDVLDWAGTQPGVLATAYEQAINSGDVAQIKTVIDTYRSATGTEVPKPAATPAAPASPADEDAVEAMRRPQGRRVAPAVEPDPNNFDDAFAEAAKAV